MNLSRTSMALTVIVITISSVAPAYAQRGKSTVPPPKAVGQANRPPKPNASAPKAPKSDIAVKIASRPKLALKLQPLLPENMTLEEAAAGFKNQGQFIAALHVASNHPGISFVDLKALMTGPEQKSLGQSIKELRPAVDAEAAVNTAEQQARQDEQVANQ